MNDFDDSETDRTMKLRNRKQPAVSTMAVFLAACLSCFAQPELSYADDETGPIFVKVYAGVAANSYREFERKVRKNMKDKVSIEDSTVIPCKVGSYYGLGVIISAPGKQFFSFETTAIWRDLNNYDEPRRYNRTYSLRKSEYGTRRFFYEVRANSVDHDMTFIMHIGQQVFARHKFQIRGCGGAAESVEPT